VEDRWRPLVVLIRSSNPAHRSFGTGFPFYCEGQVTWIVTCAHVVDDIISEINEGGGESNKITADDAEATLVASGLSNNSGIDIAVLRVGKPLDRLSLRRAFDEKGKSFTTSGFQRSDRDFIIRQLEGTFGGQIETGRGEQAHFVKAWDLEINDSRHHLQDGYSGSPVIDRSNCAVAVVNTKEGTGNRGTAISVEAIEKVWSEMPPHLFELPPCKLPRRKVLLVGLVAGGVVAIGGITGITWWILSAHPLYTYHGHSGSVYSVAWSPDSKRIASASTDMTVQVWDAADGGNVYIYRGHADFVEKVAWSPNGRRIASGSGGEAGKSDNTIQAWDAADGGNVYIYRGYTSKVRAVTWSPDNKRIASTDGNNTVQVWEDGATGGNAFTYHGHSGDVYAVAWSPPSTDRPLIASGGTDMTVQVWDAADGSHVYSYPGDSGYVQAVAWSPDGKRIVSGGSTVQVWDAENGNHVYTYRGHSGNVYSVAWSPDSKQRIASAGGDKTVQIWDAENGNHINTYPGYTHEVAWSPDGTRIAFANDDGTVQVWQAM
jgi:WD40 repeat protein